RLAENHTRRFALQRHLIPGAGDLPLTVDRVTQRVDHTAEEAFAHFDRSNGVGPFYFGAFFNIVRRTEEHDTHVVLFKVQNDSLYACFEFYKLTGSGVGKTIYTGDTVTYRQY